ncbi:MAG: hypothetical protein R3E66_03200 [bacterium]
MNTLVQGFHEGGVWMWIILILSVVSYIGSIVALTFFAVSFRRRIRLTLIWFGAILLTLGVAIFVIGIVAYSVGISQVEHSLAYIEPNLIDEARMRGTESAMLPLNFSLIMGGFPTLAGLIALVRGIKTPKS